MNRSRYERKPDFQDWLKRMGIALGMLLALYLLFALLLTLIHPRFFYHLLYPGDHVSGTVRLVVDGETVPLDPEDFTDRTGEGMRGSRLRVRPRADGSVRIAYRAGDYGPYRVSLCSEALEQPLTLTVYQYNSWNVCRFELEILVDREAGTIEYRCQTRTLNEQAHFVEEHRPEDVYHDRLDEPRGFSILRV